MFITKKHISRRTMLKGAGVAVALPLLDAMIPAGTAHAQTAAKPTLRLGFIYVPHGAVMLPGNDQWTPRAQGPNFDLPRILAPLQPFQKCLTVVSGMENKPAESSSVHAIVPATWLGCVHPHKTQDPYAAITADQIAAQHIGQDTPLPSIEVATEKGGIDAACDRTYGCVYSSTIAFQSPTKPLPMEYNPHKLFQRLFGRGETPQERAALSRRYTSVLDLIAGDTASLERNLGPHDRSVLNDYLESVREVEQRAHKMAHSNLAKLDLPHVPAGIPDSFEQHLKLNFDMIALAWQADLTRIATFMMACEVSQMTYPQIGVRDAFHPLSHHDNDPDKLDRLSKIQAYHSHILAGFLQRLAATPDGDGSLLDHVMLLYGSNMSDSNIHNQFPLPAAVLGGACGKIKGNQHVRLPDHTPIANLHLTLLHRAGVPIEKIGDSNAEVSEI